MCIKVKVGELEQAFNPVSTDETPGEVVLLVKVGFRFPNGSCAPQLWVLLVFLHCATIPACIDVVHAAPTAEHTASPDFKLRLYGMTDKENEKSG
jgi:hypothetical protein